jgi:molybdenum cofactor biosynthesis protein A
MDPVLLDTFERPLRNLRLSVTDRCNLRCSYCMPEPEYVWLPREDILHFEEIETLVDIFTTLGVDKVRLTGGEPLLRRGLPDLVARLAKRATIRDLAMTTNGVLLAQNAKALKDAGLHRLTVSLDTLQRDRFQQLTRYDELDRVLEGIDIAAPLFSGLKLDTVVIRGVNDDELVPLIEFARDHGAEVRFIEYMDVGGATHWSMSRVVPRAEMLDRLQERYGRIAAVDEISSAPADRYRLPTDDLRDHLVDHGALLCRLRSQPADRGRNVVPVPVRESRNRPSRSVAWRSVRGADRRAHSPDMAGTPGPWRRGASRVARPLATHPRGQSPPGSSSGNAHARRIAPPRNALGRWCELLAVLIEGRPEMCGDRRRVTRFDVPPLHHPHEPSVTQ